MTNVYGSYLKNLQIRNFFHKAYAINTFKQICLFQNDPKYRAVISKLSIVIQQQVTSDVLGHEMVDQFHKIINFICCKNELIFNA